MVYFLAVVLIFGHILFSAATFSRVGNESEMKSNENQSEIPKALQNLTQSENSNQQNVQGYPRI